MEVGFRPRVEPIRGTSISLLNYFLGGVMFVLICVGILLYYLSLLFFQVQWWSSLDASPWRQTPSAEIQIRTRRGWDLWSSVTSSLWPGRKARVWRPLRLRAPLLFLHPCRLWSIFSCHQTPNKVC